MDATSGAFMFPGQWAGSFAPAAYKECYREVIFMEVMGEGLEEWMDGGGERERERVMCDLEGTLACWPSRENYTFCGLTDNNYQ